MLADVAAFLIGVGIAVVVYGCTRVLNSRRVRIWRLHRLMHHTFPELMLSLDPEEVNEIFRDGIAKVRGKRAVILGLTPPDDKDDTILH